ncbi:uncharacterized protein LOC119402637 [Rhipicephalus sanguineus]|uniref:uncharacterized protein LOC119402637 n=1 Tax=Rhipicephalus sanguineus TaxID=34632 RepID=UPI0018940FF3|nr:uncharacterized protein LOC119402637 [Rhipicephalus sanguineus]
MAKNSEGTYVKIAISEKKEVMCELVGKRPKNLDACEECQNYMQTWVTLRCDHKVCNECFNEYPSYICSKDKKRTTKGKARTEGCNKLRNSRVYCPACQEEHTCTNITNHISCKHPELLENADESVRPPYTEAMARSETEPQRGEEKRERLWGNPPQAFDAPATHTGSDSKFDADMLTEDESSDSAPPTSDEASLDRDIGTCRHCNTALEKKEIPGHEERCPDLGVQCPFCSEEMAFKTVQGHINTACPVRKGEQSG